MLAIEEILLTVSKQLDIPYIDVYKIIENAIAKQNPEDFLIDLIGLDHIELVFGIIENKKYFQNFERRNDEIAYLEHIFPKQNSIVVDKDQLVPVTQIRDYKKYFTFEYFNPVQSKVFEAAYNSDKNILISAPTGSGKTDAALLTILRCIHTYKDSQIIYVVPMKALATEIFRKYSTILPNVIEYTGDTEVTPLEANRARVIVCTPEKFDVSTRRLCPTFLNIKLVIIDEIHILEDKRGPVIESIVARMHSLSVIQQSIIRIVGLSATLPNYIDVGNFIKADCVFNFGQMYRPVPLETHIIGFKKSSKQADEIDFILKQISYFRGKNKQVLIFVTSRPKTVKVAKMIIDGSIKNYDGSDLIKKLINSDIHILGRKKFITKIMNYLVENGVGIHHAGLPREDRLHVEQMFRDKKIDILISTSTLAWGVNLPAHAVFIYGTSYYNPSIANFDDLGICDILQIFGRAGRPQYDIEGVAFLITQSNKLDYYLKLIKRSNDIESKMLFHVTDNLCAEIYLRNILNLSSAFNWIKNTFLYIRMRKNPAVYGLLQSEIQMEEQALVEYIYLSILRLEDIGLIRIIRPETNYNTWTFESTFYGRICSIFYLSHETLSVWLEELNALNNLEKPFNISKNIDCNQKGHYFNKNFLYSDFSGLLNIFFKSKEFNSISLRAEESEHLMKLSEQFMLDRIINFEFDETLSCKCVLLILSHIYYAHLSLFSLQCDLIFIIENLERMINAFKEIALYERLFDIFEIAFFLERNIKKQKCVYRKTFSINLIKVGSYGEIKIDNILSTDLESGLTDTLTSQRFIDSKKSIDENSKPNFKKYKEEKPLKDNFYVVFVKVNGAIIEILEFKSFLQEFIFLNYHVNSTSNLGLSIEIHGTNHWTVQKELIFPDCDFSISALYKYGIHSCKSRFSICGIQRPCIHFTIYSELYEELMQDNNFPTEYCDSNLSTSSKPSFSARFSQRNKPHQLNETSVYKSSIMRTFLKANYNSDFITNNLRHFKESTNIKEDVLIKTEKNLECNPNILRFVEPSLKYSCETFGNIIDVNFEMHFQFFPLDYGHFNEQLKYINHRIFAMEISKPHLIVCPNKEDVESTIKELNTLNCLKKLDLSKFQYQEYNRSNVMIFGKAKSHKLADIIVFKTCRSKFYYPIYEICKIGDRKDVIIFESQVFLNYLQDVIKSA